MGVEIDLEGGGGGVHAAGVSQDVGAVLGPVGEAVAIAEAGAAVFGRVNDGGGELLEWQM